MRRLLIGLMADSLRFVFRALVCFGLARLAAALILFGKQSLTLSASGLSLLLAAFLFALWGGR